MSHRPSTPAPKWRSAGLVRRVLAVGVDAGAAAAVVAAGFGVGLFDRRVLGAPPGWFWSEWLFKLWLDEPAAVVAPAASFVALAMLWTAVWEALSSRTPGARLTGLLVVDASACTIGPLRAGRRALGALVNLATLGFGYLWVAVSPARRGWHDYIGGTWVVVDRRSN